MRILSGLFDTRSDATQTIEDLIERGLDVDDLRRLPIGVIELRELEVPVAHVVERGRPRHAQHLEEVLVVGYAQQSSGKGRTTRLGFQDDSPQLQECAELEGSRVSRSRHGGLFAEDFARAEILRLSFAARATRPFHGLAGDPQPREQIRQSSLISA